MICVASSVVRIQTIQRSKSARTGCYTQFVVRCIWGQMGCFFCTLLWVRSLEVLTLSTQYWPDYLGYFQMSKGMSVLSYVTCPCVIMCMYCSLAPNLLAASVSSNSVEFKPNVSLYFCDTADFRDIAPGGGGGGATCWLPIGTSLQQLARVV
eukprot:jgi/Botrbrau1/13039/Bobra.0187s0002.1